MDFSGVFAALTTPFAADDSVAIAHLKQNIQRYNATGLAGYAVQGSTGESVLLSRAEWDSVLVAAKEAASPQKRLLAGTGVESTAETISRTKRAAELGYDAALVRTPYYYKPVYKPEVFIAHYRRGGGGLPLLGLLYFLAQITPLLFVASELGIAGVKFVMDQRGYYGGLPRLPLLPLSDAAKKRVLEFLAALEPAAARA